MSDHRETLMFTHFAICKVADLLELWKYSSSDDLEGANAPYTAMEELDKLDKWLSEYLTNNPPD